MAKNWAICIGINQYQYIKSLNCAVNDADKMDQWLKNTQKFEKIYLFTDNSPPITDGSAEFSSQPTYTNLRRWLRKRFHPNLKKFLSPSDNLWFFFSGHGWRHQGEDYLLLGDSDPDPEEIDNSALKIDWIVDYLRNSGAGNIMLLIDACRDSAKNGIGLDFSEQQGVIFLASCSPNEKSYEIPELSQGSFTYALIESLTIQGENNCATVERLCKRVKSRVRELNQQYKQPKQTPIATIEPETKSHLILLPDYIKPTLADIQQLKIQAMNAELTQQNLRLAEILWTRLVIHDLDEALEHLLRIRQKLRETPLNNTLTTPESNLVTQGENKSVTETPSETNTNKLPKTYTEDLGNGVSLEMVLIPAGSFMMGTEDAEIAQLCQQYNTDWFNNEKPRHEVSLKAFYMGKYPVTQAQYEAVMGNNPSWFQNAEKAPLSKGGWGDHPVEQVSWNDAKAFCQKLSQMTGKSYQLPSEAQWEYACRAESPRTGVPLSKGDIGGSGEVPLFKGDIGGSKWCFGDNESLLKDYAWYGANSSSQTHPVGEKKPNNWGLYDMHGNVWEWCEDDFVDSYENTPRDGTAHRQKPMIYIVLRGGSWDFNPNVCRSAFRSFNTRAFRSNSFGFRVIFVVGKTT
jgi:formylglycine-generating enzyme required for sulfatase activity